MRKAETYLKAALEQLLHNSSRDKNPRPRYESDGEPAHSRYITQVVMQYDISKGEIPITETRHIAWRTGIKEMLLFYQMQTNKIKDFERVGLNWWGSWKVTPSLFKPWEWFLRGTIGKRYGYTVKKYKQMYKLLRGLKDDPFGRRHIMDLWQLHDFKSEKGLKPCAIMTMWSVRDVDGVMYLDMTLTQRSSDFSVAGFINQMQYLALQMMVAKHCGYEVGKFMHTIQNLHVYDRHMPQLEETLRRLDCEQVGSVKENVIDFELRVPSGTNFYDIELKDFELFGYLPQKPQLLFELAI